MSPRSIYRQGRGVGVRDESGARQYQHLPGEEGAQSDDDAGVILPTDTWKEYWDMLVLALILYSALVAPYRICFNAEAEGAMYWFEEGLTMIFLVDVVLSFNTAFYENELWVRNRRRIAVRYLSGWFWVDFPSSIPIELITYLQREYGDGGDAGDGAKVLRLFRLFRLLRLLKLLKLGDSISAVEERFDVDLSFLRIFQMVVSLLYLAHLLGCFWFYVAVAEGLDPEIVTWVSAYDDGSGLDATNIDRYLYSLYWALTTLTTVGYGDITPTNNAERYYALFALPAGAIVYGFMLSSIGSLIQSVDKQAALVQQRMDEVKEYMRWRKLPRELVARLRRYYNFYYSRKAVFDEEKILGGLTPALRFEVVQHAVKDTIGKIPLFASSLDPLFQLEVFPLLKPLSIAPGDLIYQYGDVSHDLLFLIKGQVEVLSRIDSKVLYVIAEGEYFGESVLTGRRRPATLRAAKSAVCELYTISAEALGELFARRPREGRIIYQNVMKELRRKELMRSLALRFTLAEYRATSRYNARKTIAALQLQLGWFNLCTRLVYANAVKLQQENVDQRLSEQISRSGITPYDSTPRGSCRPAVATEARRGSHPVQSAAPLTSSESHQQTSEQTAARTMKMSKAMDELRGDVTQMRREQALLRSSVEKMQREQASIAEKFDRLFAYMPAGLFQA